MGYAVGTTVFWWVIAGPQGLAANDERFAA